MGLSIVNVFTTYTVRTRVEGSRQEVAQYLVAARKAYPGVHIRCIGSAPHCNYVKYDIVRPRCTADPKRGGDCYSV